MASKSGSVDPSGYPDELFDLYSIPAFDKRQPEVVAGNSIGSTKQIVRPGDVLLSKIVPHIRRSWVVGSEKGRRIIASGEWIVFRSDRIHPDYLRNVLISDPFHAQFMSTVSGVGGSLLRARPEHVAKIEIPFPPLSEQRRIAEVLDRAEALRVKRHAALAQLDALIQAIFLDLFGDPATNPKAWPCIKLGELIITGPQNGLYKPAGDYGSGTPILRIDAFYDGVVTKITTLKRVRVSNNERDLYGLHGGEIVLNRVNSMEYLGKSALIPNLDEPTVFESNMMRFDIDRRRLEPRYAVEFLQSSFIKTQIVTAAKHAVNQSSINQQDVKAFRINVPPLPLQNDFIRRVAAVEKLTTVHRASLADLGALVAALQYRAFRGNL
jgi:type I restriction enzyme S subunit